MAATMIPIQSVTLTASAASITFSGIPQTYTDLVLRFSLRCDQTASQAVYVRLNGDSSAVYSTTSMYAFPNGFSSAFSNRGTGGADLLLGYANGTGTTSNSFSSFEMYLPNYTAATNKPFSSTNALETNTTGAYDAYLATDAHLFRGTAAVSSLSISVNTGNLVVGNTAHLYGIL